MTDEYFELPEGDVVIDPDSNVDEAIDRINRYKMQKKIEQYEAAKENTEDEEWKTDAL